MMKIMPGGRIHTARKDGRGLTRNCSARDRGQVVTEYVIMLVMVLLLAFALTALSRAVCDQGERMVNAAAWNIP